MGTKKGQVRKTARRAYEPKRRKVRKKAGTKVRRVNTKGLPKSLEELTSSQRLIFEMEGPAGLGLRRRIRRRK